MYEAMTEILRQVKDQNKKIVFFGGAGVSTESGIPDFRSKDGLYNQQFAYPPEEILSATFFAHHPDEFYRFYWRKMIYEAAEPNGAHLALAHWEQMGWMSGVVTQNIDGLHQKAGSRKVFELHGSVQRYYCMHCHKFYALKDLVQEGIPYCSCGGMIKPDVVLYEEALDSEVIEQSIAAIEAADILIIGGTSLNVYPAAGLIRYFRGQSLILINKESTFADRNADLVIRDPIGQVLKTVDRELSE